MLTPENNNELSELINSTTGLHFPEDKFTDIERAVRYILKENNFKSVNDLLLWIKSKENDADKVDLITKYFTVGETYFFRDRNVINALNETILPEIIQRKYKKDRRIKVWSAASSTGEELYTLAILIEELLKDKSGWEIELMGSDINKEFLAKAKKGIYTKWSIRGDEFPVLNDYVTPLPNNLFEVNHLIKSRVKFFHLNLKSNNYPSQKNDLNSVDLILCRNVLMYFDDKTKADVVNKLRKTLDKDGWIIFSPFDLNDENKKLFITVSAEDTVVYRVSDSINNNTPIQNKNELNSIANTTLLHIKKPKVSTIKHEKKTSNTLNCKQIISKRAIRDYDEIHRLYEKGKYGDIIKLYESKELEPEMGGTKATNFYLTLLKSYANLGLKSGFENTVSEALKMNKTSAEIHYVCGSIYKEFNELQKSVYHLKKALYLNHDFIMAEFMLGLNYRAIGDAANAKRCFRNINKMLKSEDNNSTLDFSEGLKVIDIKSIVQKYSNE